MFSLARARYLIWCVRWGWMKIYFTNFYRNIWSCKKKAVPLQANFG